MKAFVFTLACTLLFIAPLKQTQASIIVVAPSDFLPGATIIDFETGTSVLPTVPGVTFLDEGTGADRFYGTATSVGFFGNQGWANTVSSTYSNLGLELATPVDAIGAYVGRIPNFRNEHPSQVVVELFDSSMTSLGSESITIPAAFDSPVWFGFSGSASIARLEIRGNDSGFFGVDNVTFGEVSSAVPEPSTFTLLGIGGIVLVGYGVRRKRQQAA